MISHTNLLIHRPMDHEPIDLGSFLSFQGLVTLPPDDLVAFLRFPANAKDAQHHSLFALAPGQQATPLSVAIAFDLRHRRRFTTSWPMCHQGIERQSEFLSRFLLLE